jgi:hypothetical protein
MSLRLFDFQGCHHGVYSDSEQSASTRRCASAEMAASRRRRVSSTSVTLICITTACQILLRAVSSCK